MNVLSVFDGMSCGMIALRKLGKRVDRYFASEIDKHAIKVSQANWFEIEHIGSVTGVSAYKLPKIDLFIGGSPCQGFSFAGKQLNFDDPRSALFFHYVRILKEIRKINPDVKFFLENVRMKQEYQDIITEYLGVQPVLVNSTLVSAQNRVRLYWTNIEGFEMPVDREIYLKDIVHEFADFPKYETTLSVPEATKRGYCQVTVGDCVDLKHINSKSRRGRLMDDKSNCLTAGSMDYYHLYHLEQYTVPLDKMKAILENEIKTGKVGFNRNNQDDPVYYIHDQAVSIPTTIGGGPTGNRAIPVWLHHP